MLRIRAKLNEKKNKPRLRYALIVQRGKFVKLEEFKDVFENASDVFKFFEHDIVFGAIIDERARKVYFITVNIDRKCTTLIVMETEFEAKP